MVNTVILYIYFKYYIININNLLMKRTLLLSMLLLLTGVGMKAQSIAEKQMDERFNDGTKMP